MGGLPLYAEIKDDEVGAIVEGASQQAAGRNSVGALLNTAAFSASRGQLQQLGRLNFQGFGYLPDDLQARVICALLKLA